MIKTDKRSTAATPELVPLKDARLSVMSESNEGEALNEARLKSITGGDEIYARDLYKSSITFTSNSKIVLVTNNLPSFNIADGGMMRRIRLFPFINRFTRTPESDQFIEDIKNKYIDSLFSLLIDAGSEYHSGKRLVICDFMNVHLKEYISELDHETHFFEENYNIIEECVYTSSFQKRTLLIKRTDVYKHFQDYLRENVIHKKYTQKQFTEICNRKNIVQKVVDGNNYLCLTSKNDNHKDVKCEV
jgi:phage/plasmid-associated DNA primase